MYSKTTFLPILTILLAACVCLSFGCSPRPPVPYQQLQVQDMEESEGFDVYMYVAVKNDVTGEQVTTLLEWFRDVKFAEVNKMRIFVWDNPQSALIGATGDMVGSLDVDRENGINRIDINVD